MLIINDDIEIIFDVPMKSIKASTCTWLQLTGPKMIFIYFTRIHNKIYNYLANTTNEFVFLIVFVICKVRQIFLSFFADGSFYPWNAHALCCLH